MKYLHLTFWLVFLSSVSNAQVYPRATPVPSSTPTSVGNTKGADIPASGNTSPSFPTVLWETQIRKYYVEPLYRKPTKAELKLLEVDKNTTEKYKNFLENSGGTIFRLIPDYGCSEDSAVVVVNDRCLKYNFPGSGSGYSFRIKNYRLWRLADLIYTGEKIASIGKYQQGIMVNIGNVELESLQLDRKEFLFLKNYKPISNTTEAQKDFIKFKSGIVSENVKYASILPIEVQSTYLLRTIAYQAKYLRASNGITYNEFDYDKRMDIIVAFRIIKKDEDNSLIILWKILEKKDAPKLE